MLTDPIIPLSPSVNLGKLFEGYMEMGRGVAITDGMGDCIDHEGIEGGFCVV